VIPFPEPLIFPVHSAIPAIVPDIFWQYTLWTFLPRGQALYHKGARLSVIFTFIGATAIVRIPMTLFEASFLGFEFTAIRWLVSIPLVIVSSIFLEKYMVKKTFSIK